MVKLEVLPKAVSLFLVYPVQIILQQKSGAFIFMESYYTKSADHKQL